FARRLGEVDQRQDQRGLETRPLRRRRQWRLRERAVGDLVGEAALAGGRLTARARRLGCMFEAELSNPMQNDLARRAELAADASQRPAGVVQGAKAIVSLRRPVEFVVALANMLVD